MFQSLFPAGRTGRRYVNLDNAATTPAFVSVQAAVFDFLTTYGSVHRGAGRFSKLSTDAYEVARNEIRRFVGAPNDSYVVFTGNTTGAMNQLAHHFSFLSGDVLVGEYEHSSSWLPWVVAEGERRWGHHPRSLAEMGDISEAIPRLGREHVRSYQCALSGEVDLVDLERQLISHRDWRPYKVVILTAGSNVTGWHQSIAPVAEIVHRHCAMLVVDGCQHVQHRAIDMVAEGADFLCASGHKFYAPYGGGFFIGPKHFLDRFLPYQIGGGNLPYISESGRFIRYETDAAHDPGTPNAVGAVAMAAAFQELSRIGMDRVQAYEDTLARRAYDGLEPIPGVRLLVDRDHLGSVIPFLVAARSPASVAEELNERFDIGIRAGSFCSYRFARDVHGIVDDSKIAAAVRRGDTSMIPGFCRASIGLCNTDSDIDRLVTAVRTIAEEVTRG